jgi:hypothetical protein
MTSLMRRVASEVISVFIAKYTEVFRVRFILALSLIFVSCKDMSPELMADRVAQIPNQTAPTLGFCRSSDLKGCSPNAIIEHCEGIDSHNLLLMYRIENRLSVSRYCFSSEMLEPSFDPVRVLYISGLPAAAPKIADLLEVAPDARTLLGFDNAASVVFSIEQKILDPVDRSQWLVRRNLDGTPCAKGQISYTSDGPVQSAISKKRGVGASIRYFSDYECSIAAVSYLNKVVVFNPSVSQMFTINGLTFSVRRR